MTDLTSTSNFYEQETGVTKIDNSPYGFKEVLIELPATADTADTVDLTLENYGMTSISSVVGWTHTTTGSVVLLEEPTTSVTTGVLTITPKVSGLNNQKKVYLVGGI